MEVPLSELLDRLVIVRLKKERVQTSEKDEEYKFYMKELEVYKTKGYEIRDEWLEKLYDTNGKIWDLEADIRAGKEGKFTLEEIGKRALEIRDLNRIRIQIKNEIVEVTGSGFKDIKINHASEEND